MIGDRELANLRQKYYGLFVKLFWKEPDSEFLLSLLEGIAEREKGSAQSSQLISEGWKDIRIYLEKKGAYEVENEFVQLFLGPHEAEIIPYESYYLTGRMFQAPLAAVRGFMKEVGLEKKEGQLPEPEDTLGFELEIMNWLVVKQTSSEDAETEEQWLDKQARFLKEHLLVWGPAFAQEVESATHADFYKGAGKLLRGFLELEKQLFHDRGPEKIESLQTLRKRYGSRKEWKGPLFEPVPENKADS